MTNSMKEDAPVESTGDSIPQLNEPIRRANLIQFQINGWRFSAPLLPLLVVLALLPGLASLGFWQLDRAAEKEQLQAAFAEQMEGPAVELLSSELTKKKQRYLKVDLQGQLRSDGRQFLLDNRVHKGRAGYEVFVPLYLNDGGVILLNRGWLPVGLSRVVKPQVELASQDVRVIGVAAIPPERFSLGDALSEGDRWPKSLQFEDFSAMQLALGLDLDLVPRILQPVEDSAWSFERIWRAVEKDSTQNYGYAVQWFALALALALLVLFVCLKRVQPDNLR